MAVMNMKVEGAVTVINIKSKKIPQQEKKLAIVLCKFMANLLWSWETLKLRAGIYAVAKVNLQRITMIYKQGFTKVFIRLFLTALATGKEETEPENDVIKGETPRQSTNWD